MRPDLAATSRADAGSAPTRPPSPPLDVLVHQRVLSATPDDPLDDPALADLVRAEAPLLGTDEVTDVVMRVRARIGGLGPLEPLLADPAVSDVLINGPGPVWVERSGRLERTSVCLDRAGIALLVERVVAPLGLRADRATPVVDARLPDGSRVHVVLPPLAVDGPAVTIRRFGATVVPLAWFCDREVVDLLAESVRSGLNIVVSGGTGAGKTTLLNALCSYLPAGERVVTVEDAAELRLPGDHVVRLETRPPSPDGLPAVGVRELVRAALRMRPDRIVVGEVRGAEALDMLQAMNTGHGGCLSTCHANGTGDALRRIETMALLGGAGVPLAAVRSQMLGAVDLVVHMVRTDGARRRVAAVAEVVEGAAGEVGTRALIGPDGRVLSPCRRPARRHAPDRALPARDVDAAGVAGPAAGPAAGHVAAAEVPA
jgi:pilus assembly protein CpaF